MENWRKSSNVGKELQNAVSAKLQIGVAIEINLHKSFDVFFFLR